MIAQMEKAPLAAGPSRKRSDTDSSCNPSIPSTPAPAQAPAERWALAEKIAKRIDAKRAEIREAEKGLDHAKRTAGELRAQRDRLQAELESLNRDLGDVAAGRFVERLPLSQEGSTDDAVTQPDGPGPTRVVGGVAGDVAGGDGEVRPPDDERRGVPTLPRDAGGAAEGDGEGWEAQPPPTLVDDPRAADFNAIFPKPLPERMDDFCARHALPGYTPGRAAAFHADLIGGLAIDCHLLDESLRLLNFDANPRTRKPYSANDRREMEAVRKRAGESIDAKVEEYSAWFGDVAAQAMYRQCVKLSQERKEEPADLPPITDFCPDTQEVALDVGNSANLDHSNWWVSIVTCRRPEGGYAVQWDLILKRILQRGSEGEFRGCHPTRAAAVAVAADDIHGILRTSRFTGRPAEWAKAVVRVLDGLDKEQADAPGGAAADNKAAVAEDLAKQNSDRAVSAHKAVIEKGGTFDEALAAGAKALDDAQPGLPAKAKFHRFDDDVAEVLRTRLQYDGNNVVIGGPRLDPKLYQKVNKVLAHLGGKWTADRTQAHVFPSPAKPLIETALGEGKVLDRKQSYQFFETPRDLAERMVRLAEIKPGMEVLEPSAGRGAIADVIRDGHPETEPVCVELEDANVRSLEAKGHNVRHDDFLRWGTAGTGTERLLFDRILMNPPFTGGQDVIHVRHAYEILKPGGRLVAIMSMSPFTRDTRAGADFIRWLEADAGIAQTEELPAGTFAESGTNVPAMLVTIEKWPEGSKRAAAAAPGKDRAEQRAGRSNSRKGGRHASRP